MDVPDNIRGFWDPPKMRSWVKDNVVGALDKTLNTVESNNFKLKVSNVRVDAPEIIPLKDQKQALLERRDLFMPVKATVDLVDKRSGKTVDTKNTTLAQIPYVTDRNTVIMAGTEYSPVAQQRLRPGVYTKPSNDGTIVGQVNVKPGTGMNVKLVFDPDTAVFTMGIGTTQVKLYGLLKGMGVSDSQMEQAWGKDIFDKNRKAYKGDEMGKAFNKIFNR